MAVLIYKSIRAAIQAQEGRQLFCLPPLPGGEETPRTVFVSKELRDYVVPPAAGWPDTRDGRLFSRLRALFDDFTEGGWVTVAENPFDKDANAILARVAPVEEEVWVFRCLDPKPGVRAFGCFSERDTFVALTWDYRENLENDDYWRREVAGCRAEWRRLFGGIAPLSGKTLNEYIAYNVRSV